MPRSRKALLLVNRGSGGLDGIAGRMASRIEQALKASGIAAEIELLGGGGIATCAHDAVQGGFKLLIVAGGDGSVSAAAGALAGTDCALGILPLGTRNHFSRDLGIPADLDHAAALIASGSTTRVDIAEMNGRTFVNNSVIGLYPLMVADRDSQRARLHRGKRLAIAVAAARTLARFRHQRLTLTINGERERLVTPLLFVGNNRYRLGFPGAGTRERLDAGVLSVLVMRKTTRRGFVAAVLRALAGRARPDDVERIDGVQRLRVGSRRSRLTVSLDGELLQMSSPLDYRIRKGALRVIAPAAEGGNRNSPN